MTGVDMNSTAASGASTGAMPATRFTGDTRAYWRLQLRGAALLAVTLGIYRFWLATDVRRFLWSHSEVGGEPLEYTGTAYELLMGFLIAIALLVPLYLLLFLVAMSMGTAGQYAGAFSIPILLFLGQFAAYRARRYRLTRTIYRGIRCHQTGSALRYAVCAAFWWILIILTLGLAYPFAQSRLERFKMRHTYFGNLQGRFEGSGWRLFMRGLPMWFATIGLLAGATVFAAVSVNWNRIAELATRSRDGRDFANRLGGEYLDFYTAAVVAAIALSASIVMAVVLFPAFQAMMLRWWLAGTRFGALTVHAESRARKIYGAYFRFLGYTLLLTLSATILSAIVIGAGAGLATTVNSQVTQAVSALLGIGLYVAMMLGYSAIYQTTVKLALWRNGFESMSFDGLATLDKVSAEGAPSSAIGEGLADALNVGGI